jgi:signal transduction histidine kinase
MRTLAAVHRPHAHDVRSVLNAMQLSVELLTGLLADDEAAAAPGGIAQWQRHVSVLREELAKLNRSLRPLLEQPEPLGLARQRFDVRDPIHELAAVLRSQAARQRVAMSLHLPDVPVMVHGNRDRLRQALLNLLLHALNGMPDKGRLAIRLAAAETDCQVHVEHSGLPLEDEARRRLERLEPAGDDGGRLASLCAARLVAESHGGGLSVEGLPDKGERLRLRLRYAAPQAAQRSASPP